MIISLFSVFLKDVGLVLSILLLLLSPSTFSLLLIAFLMFVVAALSPSTQPLSKPFPPSPPPPPSESAYLSASSPAVAPSPFLSKFPALASLVAAAGPTALVLLAVAATVVGFSKADRMVKEGKERDRLEEIELYGEELSVDATPVEAEDGEEADEDED